MKDLENELNERVNSNDICFLFWFIYFLKKNKEVDKERLKLIKEILKELKDMLEKQEKSKESRFWKFIGRASAIIGIGSVAWQIMNGLFLSLQFNQGTNKKAFEILKFDQFNLSEFDPINIEKAIIFAQSKGSICKYNL